MKKNEARILKRYLEILLREVEAMSAEPEEDTIPREIVREVIREKPQYYNAKQAQQFLGIKQSTFYQWIQEGRICHGRYLGPKSPRWTREELESAFVK